MRDFIHDHAGPRFERDHNGSLKMWLGTLNTFDFLECPNTVLSDIATKRFIGGAALQYAGKGMIERVHHTWPDLPLIQSENECGDGTNTYEYAIYIFDLMRHYLGNGVRGCEYQIVPE
jgi:glucosylceramidase